MYSCTRPPPTSTEVCVAARHLPREALPSSQCGHYSRENDSVCFERSASHDPKLLYSLRFDVSQRHLFFLACVYFY